MYEIRFAAPAAKYLKKIREKGLKNAFNAALVKISENPYIGKQKIGDLHGIYGYDVYYSGINYEIAYRIYEEDGRFVLVVLIGTRENFHDELKRLL